ncbi:hypothetical protein SLEP1_g47142 [Rubroshorea leprosula]|uniref:Uncharacterized protein n=1 Tax=Rubroshorea leprosula TaxID=152421 RepID=A0AAV5LPN5_9ROSI|nr:hypothetical protein SLEP1_g47142 [Rubroshorea leprosula]
MAELIVGPFMDVMISKVISVTTGQLNLAVGFKQQLEKLPGMLGMLKGVLQDAEQKKVSHSGVQGWLEELGKIVDEVDDVVDEIAYEHLRSEVAQVWEKVSYFFTLSNPLAFRLKIACRIKNLNLKLADLNKRAHGLGLQEILASKHPEYIETQQTDSSIGDPSQIVGRENKVLEVVESLTDSSNDQPLLVVSIVGKHVGGRILITTGSENVASTMGTLSKHMHHLEKLTDEDCWSIIKQRAFGSSSFSSELEGIGRDIGSKCKGLALVANVIGGSLCNNRKKDNWLSIKDNSEVWGSIEKANGVLRVLQLSFNRLPTPALKQCFAFCSIFPKDCVMEKEMLIQLWMAGGFLQPFHERYLEMEDIGDEYFNALSSYSLFQDVKRDSYGSIITCKMHDLVHDLAQFVSKSQTLILEDGSGRNIPANIRHLNVISNKGTATTKLGDATEKLHILFSQVDVFHSMSTSLRNVRALSFCNANVDELPAFLGKMKHLRFLDVSGTKIKELPKVITRLYQLQTFRFMDCWEINRPLEGIWDLINLRHIYFNQQKLMPPRIGGLTYLKTLQLFVVGQQKGHHIEELRCLSQLKGKLEICNLHMVRDKEEAMGARLSEKATIQELQLAFGGESNGSEDRCKHDEDILEGLQPHSNLKGLIVECYCGKSCPTWMSEIENPMSERVNFLENLVFISLYQCPWLERIPSLSLNDEAKVEINYCKNLKSIACSSLQKLIIEGCEELVEVEVGPVAMTSLKEVHIERCGKSLSTAMCFKELIIWGCDGLTSLPSLDELSSLQKIDIYNCRQLKSIGESLSTVTCLKELIVWGCDGLTSLPNLYGLSSLQKIDIYNCRELKSIGESLSTAKCLKELSIWRCEGLTSLPSPHVLSSLQKVHIYYCGELKSIGESLSTATCLKGLTLSGCKGLTSLPSLHWLSSLQTLSIRDCGGLRSLPSGLPSCTALEELAIANCHNLISIPDDLRRSWSIPNPTCLARLKKLTIGGFSTELKEFPNLGFIRSHLEELTLIAWGKPRERLLDQIQHLTALRYLKIWDFDGLEALPEWFGSLSSLQTLWIFNCKSLKHMEAIRCLSKLERLFIERCPELKERCASGSDSEWDYISRIPKIYINGEKIQLKGDPIEILNSNLEESATKGDSDCGDRNRKQASVINFGIFGLIAVIVGHPLALKHITNAHRTSKKQLERHCHQEKLRMILVLISWRCSISISWENDKMLISLLYLDREFKRKTESVNRDNQ